MTKTNSTVPEIGGERKRIDPLVQGFREGAIKQGVNKVTEKVSLPVAEAINSKLQELHPNMALTGPMVQSLTQAIIILGCAEMIDIAGPRIPGDMATKANLGSRFMRKYAGEKVGADVVDYAAQFFPLIMAAFSEVTEEDLIATLADGEEDIISEPGEETFDQEESPVGELFLEEDEDDGLFVEPVQEIEEEVEAEKVQEPVVAQVKRRRRKVTKSSNSK